MIPTKHAMTSASAASDPLGRLKSLLARARELQAVVIGAS